LRWGGFLTIGSILFFPSLLLFCFRNPNPKEEDESTINDDAGNGKQQQRPRRLALVDRHLEKGKNGEVIFSKYGRIYRIISKATVPIGFAAMSRDFSQTISTVLRRPVYRWAMAGRIIDVMAFKAISHQNTK
jgi:hypothetical protein